MSLIDSNIIYCKQPCHPDVFEIGANLLRTCFVLAKLDFRLQPLELTGSLAWYHWIRENPRVRAPADNAGTATTSYGLQQWPLIHSQPSNSTRFWAPKCARQCDNNCLPKTISRFCGTLEGRGSLCLTANFEWNWTVASGSKVIVAHPQGCMFWDVLEELNQLGRSEHRRTCAFATSRQSQDWPKQNEITKKLHQSRKH